MTNHLLPYLETVPGQGADPRIVAGHDALSLQDREWLNAGAQHVATAIRRAADLIPNNPRLRDVRICLRWNEGFPADKRVYVIVSVPGKARNETDQGYMDHAVTVISSFLAGACIARGKADPYTLFQMQGALEFPSPGEFADAARLMDRVRMRQIGPHPEERGTGRGGR